MFNAIAIFYLLFVAFVLYLGFKHLELDSRNDKTFSLLMLIAIFWPVVVLGILTIVILNKLGLFKKE